MSKRSFGPNPWVYPQPALLVCSYSAENTPNVMTAAWGGICCSKPLLVGVSIRSERLTHENIMSTKAFTLCMPSESMSEATDFVGIVSGKGLDKFAAAGLTPIQSDVVHAPYIQECPVVLECMLAQHIDLGAHTLMLGEIKDVKIDESCLSPEGIPDIHRIKPLIFSSADRAYLGIGETIAQAFSVGKNLLK